MASLLHTLVSFIIVISVIVVVHELGHYIVARLCKVRILTFSLGFGPEIFGRTDKHGTRWKFSALPLGGYVKMFGDASAASTPDDDTLNAMSAEEKAQAFHYKPLWQKALIVLAGPVANFLLTIAVLTWLISSTGISSTEPRVGNIMPGSAAEGAGLLKDDRIISINGEEMRVFNDIPMAIATNLGTPVEMQIERAGERSTLTLTPRFTEDEDALGNKIKRPLLGIQSSKIILEEVGPLRAMGEAVKSTYGLCTTTLHAVGQMITGKRGVKDLSGPVGIAKMSGQAADKSATTLIWLIAMLSANLGLVNLFPIPLLDGGHLLFYGVEALRGRPLAEKIQEYAFRVGFALLATLMLFTLYNDISKLLA